MLLCRLKKGLILKICMCFAIINKIVLTFCVFGWCYLCFLFLFLFFYCFQSSWGDDALCQSVACCGWRHQQTPVWRPQPLCPGEAGCIPWSSYGGWKPVGSTCANTLAERDEKWLIWSSGESLNNIIMVITLISVVSEFLLLNVHRGKKAC